MARKKAGGRVTEKLPKILEGENDPILRHRTFEVKEFGKDISDLISVMFKKLKHSKGVGLAANQIGRSESVFVYHWGKDRGYFINPRIEKLSVGEIVEMEGCLSLPHLGDQLVSRPNRVTISGLTKYGSSTTVRAEGMLARIFIHEMEHLEGGLYIDQL